MLLQFLRMKIILYYNIYFRIIKKQISTDQMIDLLKNYKELNNATGYMGSIRYCLAKKKIDTLFMKWLSTNRQQVEQLLAKAQKQQLKTQQSPFFCPPRWNNLSRQAANLTNSAVLNFGLNTITPPRRVQNQQNNRKSLADTYNQNLIKSTYLMAKTSNTNQMKIDTQKIPQFYFPNGKPIEKIEDNTFNDQIKSIFAKKAQADVSEIETLTQKVLSLPVYFASLILKKYSKSIKLNSINIPETMTKDDLVQMWKELGSKDMHRRAFALLGSDKKSKCLIFDDFKVLMKIILEKHPGLQFLKQTPQFQQWYSICVINRMFFIANKKQDMKLSFRQFKNSNIMKSLYDIELQPEINLNRDFFCYEDFYVIYIKFWELDTDHDFLLTKDQFSKYCSYTFSRKAVERIFSQTARKFQHPQKMTFGDFVWFIYSSEDKTTTASIQYWFKILDLDNNGIISGYQLEYFFEEQNQRVASIDQGSTDYNYENLICQMVDLIRPKNQLQFTLNDFLNKNKEVGVFINSLIDLDKMQAYDSRDPYEERAQKNEHPDWTDWQRFVKPEYKKVEAAQELGDDEEVLNWENDQ